MSVVVGTRNNLGTWFLKHRGAKGGSTEESSWGQVFGTEVETLFRELHAAPSPAPVWIPVFCRWAPWKAGSLPAVWETLMECSGLLALPTQLVPSGE